MTLSVIDVAGVDQWISEFIVAKVLNETWGVAVNEGLPRPVFFVLEEAHNFVPGGQGTQSHSAAIIKRIASEGRKFGMFMVLITQRPYKVHADTLSQCNSQIIMRLTNPQDQQAIKLSSESISEGLLADLPGLNIGEAVILGPLVRVPVMVKVGHRESKEGGNDIDVIEKLGKSAERSQDRRARTKSERGKESARANGMERSGLGMKDKQVIITGPTSGIGKEIAMQLGALGANLVLACRDVKRGKQVAAEIAQHGKSKQIDVMEIDTSSQESIRRFARQYHKEYARLDVLINNAGMNRGAQPRALSVDGIELTFATNVLGYFLLTQELLDLLKASAPARIVNVASQFASDFDLDDLQFERRPFESFKVYAQSKACNRLFTWALARRLKGTNVTANAMAPGLVADTGLFRHAPPEQVARLKQTKRSDGGARRRYRRVACDQSRRRG